jgi:hypothetical protein
MKEQAIDVLDPPRSRLRALAASVDLYVADLEAHGANAQTVENLKQAWIALSKALALGAEPELRTCPNCSRRIPREATRCRYCMAESGPSVSGSSVSEHGT